MKGTRTEYQLYARLSFTATDQLVSMKLLHAFASMVEKTYGKFQYARRTGRDSDHAHPEYKYVINLLKPTGYVIHQQFNLLKPTGHVMHQQFNIQQLYVLPTLYLCVLYLSENKQRHVPLTS